MINNEKKASHNSDSQVYLQTNGNTIVQEPTKVANCFNNFIATQAYRTLQNNQANDTPSTYHTLHQINVNGFTM